MAAGEHPSGKNASTRFTFAVEGAESGSAGRSPASATASWVLRERPRYSLAYKFAIPMGLLTLLIMGIMVWVAQRWLYDSLLNEVKKNGATAVTLLAQNGRRLLQDKAAFDASDDPDIVRFLALAPDSKEAVLPANRHWLATGGHLDPGRWAQLCDAGAPDEPVSPDQVRRAQWNAEIFASLLHYDRSDGPNGILIAYISTPPPETLIVAASFPVITQLQINADDWIGDQGESLREVRTGGSSFLFDGIRVWAGRLREGGRDGRETLMFRAPILQPETAGGASIHLGDATVGLRADIILKERRDLARLLWSSTAVLLALSFAVTAVLARIATRPIKTLIHDMAVVSKGRFDHRTRAVSHDEIGQVARAFNVMTRQLASAQALEREALRLESELAAASAIQRNLLPARLPLAPGYDVSAFYRPARQVGGDYYDFFPIDHDHLGMVVADVSGKSIPGALMMSTTRTILRFVVSGNLDAADVLRKTNTVVAADIKRGMFVTAFYLILNTRTRRMLTASAGHNPMILARADGTLETVNPGGIALGFDKGPVFARTIRSRAVELFPGDRVVLYTDGVVEARNAHDEEYGDGQFRDFAREHRAMASRAFVDALIADVDVFVGGAEASDDITLLTFKVEE